jgi:hypothetical protein
MTGPITLLPKFTTKMHYIDIFVAYLLFHEPKITQLNFISIG